MAVSGVGNSNAADSSNNSSANNLNNTPSEGVFLNLLVAQMKNQDPLNPTDSTQFVTQLAQFSELEQVIGIRTDIESQASNAAAANNTTQA